MSFVDPRTELQNEISALRVELSRLANSMTEQDLLFCNAIIEGKTQADAYTLAGFDVKNPKQAASNRLARNYSLQEYIDTHKRMTALVSQLSGIATAHEKRQLLWTTALRCSQEITPDLQTNDFGESEAVGFTFDSAGVVRAIAELNKMDGDHAAIRHNSTVSYEPKAMTNAELDARIKELLIKTGRVDAATQH